jgi:hypothetical protein
MKLYVRQIRPSPRETTSKIAGRTVVRCVPTREPTRRRRKCFAAAGWLSPGPRRIVLAGRQERGFTRHCPNLQELWFDLTRSR